MESVPTYLDSDGGVRRGSPQRTGGRFLYMALQIATDKMEDSYNTWVFDQGHLRERCLADCSYEIEKQVISWQQRQKKLVWHCSQPEQPPTGTPISQHQPQLVWSVCTYGWRSQHPPQIGSARLEKENLWTFLPLRIFALLPTPSTWPGNYLSICGAGMAPHTGKGWWQRVVLAQTSKEMA